MNPLKQLYLAVLQFFRHLRQLPQTLANASKDRAQQTIRDEHEAERLDRIRNPSKYRGK